MQFMGDGYEIFKQNYSRIRFYPHRIETLFQAFQALRKFLIVLFFTDEQNLEISSSANPLGLDVEPQTDSELG